MVSEISRNSPVTRASLLLRIRDLEDQRAWEEFVEVYTPLVYGYCRRRGLQDGDAADVAQETMRAVAQAIGRFAYDPQRGKFRSWLLTVVRSKLHNFVAQQRRQPQPAGETTLQLNLDSSPEEDARWDADYYRRIFHCAAARIQNEFHETTWQAFWRTTVDECDGKRVAEMLGISVGAVYVAKSRVIARLKEEMQSTDAEGIMPSDRPV